MIESGCIELYTEFEGNEFVLEKLTTGSVLNHRCLFTEDSMSINVRASELTYILKLEEKSIQKVCLNDKVFSKKVMMYHDKLLRLKKNYPLDYIKCKFDKNMNKWKR